MVPQHEMFMQRCLQLAKMGDGFVAPNPMVGAVLVFENKIIGEGYHKIYGQAHAEVNCIASVRSFDRQLISRSTLYVSLEPCVHFGKTPPCTDLIIENKIPSVIIGCQDSYTKVNGKGIEKLKAAGIEVIIGILERECKELNKRFFTFHQKKMPFITLKWAQTADKKIAYNNHTRLLISNLFANRLVHKWRAHETAILVGTNTIIKDDPFLTNRLWTGKNPIRLIIDKNLKLSTQTHVFNNDAPVIVFNYHKSTISSNTVLRNEIFYYRLDKNESLIAQVCQACFELKIQSVIVEGGPTLLQTFIVEKLYDEIVVITNSKLIIGNGYNAPELPDVKLLRSFNLLNDGIDIFL
jgi:diaminohydroxyphosphoribosylaminopyrimidine deaminase/5-amino-6-(5-phosphoribosylamino)uracil reductase